MTIVSRYHNVTAVPLDYEVQPVPASHAGAATCGSCLLSWDDDTVTSMTPTPSGRCPFEYFHGNLDNIMEEARQRGENAAEWMFDGNTETDTYRAVWEAIQDGDDLDGYQSADPLSGEWAGESITELLGEDLADHPDAMDAYEEAFRNGYWDRLGAIARDCVREIDLQIIRERSARYLAADAGCAYPNGETSPGARFLELVASSLVKAVDWIWTNDDENVTDWHDVAHEVADGCVPIYTHDLWATFADLGAYQEDPTELGFDGSDMEQGARVCLYMIAERLASELLRSLGVDDV